MEDLGHASVSVSYEMSSQITLTRSVSEVLLSRLGKAPMG
jgi:hypothetical protein